MTFIGNFKGYNFFITDNPKFNPEAVWLANETRTDGGFDTCLGSIEDAYNFVNGE